MSKKKGTAGKKQHVPVMVSHRLEIIRRLESNESQRDFMVSHNIGLSTVTQSNGRTIYVHLQHQVKVTDTERAQINATGQGIVEAVYSNAFRRKTPEWAYDN